MSERKKVTNAIAVLILASMLTATMAQNIVNAEENTWQSELIKRYDGQAITGTYWDNEITTYDSPSVYISPGPYPYEFQTTNACEYILKIRQAVWEKDQYSPNELRIFVDGHLVFDACAGMGNVVDGGPNGEPYTIELGFLMPGLHHIKMSQTYPNCYLVDWWEIYSSSQPQTTLFSVSPTSIVDPSLCPGSTFRVNLTVAHVWGLWSVEFWLSYDANVLTAKRVGLYPPFKNFILRPEINDASGFVYVAAYTHIPDWIGLSTLEPVAIVWIEFTVDNRGTSQFHLYTDFYPHIDQALLGRWWGEAIPHQDVDGFFDNRPTVVMATIDIDPNTLNLKSKGHLITAYIQLPEGYDAADIDASTILLNDTISPVLDPKYGFVTNSSEYLVDHNNDGILERMVKFDRTAVESWIYHTQGIRYGDVVLTITGELLDGTPFEGTDTIFVNYAGDANNDGIINSLDIGVINAHWGTNDVSADLNKDGKVNSLDIGIINVNWGQTTP